jgi:hypothetical protein
MIQESLVKKVLTDGGSSINITFPRTFWASGIPTDNLVESNTPFFGIVRTEGEYVLGHLFMSVTFGAPDNYRIELLHFEVARFECGYNAIIRRLGLAKFISITHYRT